MMGRITFRFLYVSPLTDEHGCQQGSAVNMNVWVWHAHHHCSLTYTLPKAQSQGSSNKHIIDLWRQYMGFDWHFKYILFILTLKSICILHIYSHFLIVHLRILFPASWSGLEFKICCGWLACWFSKTNFSFQKSLFFWGGQLTFQFELEKQWKFIPASNT